MRIILFRVKDLALVILGIDRI